MANESNNIDSKREKVDALRQEIEDRKQAASAERTDQENEAREERLDREIAALQHELARMDQQEALARGEKPEPVPPVEEMTVEQLKGLPEYNRIEGRSEMKKDELAQAIAEAKQEGSN